MGDWLNDDLQVYIYKSHHLSVQTHILLYLNMFTRSSGGDRPFSLSVWHIWDNNLSKVPSITPPSFAVTCTETLFWYFRILLNWFAFRKTNWECGVLLIGVWHQERLQRSGGFQLSGETLMNYRTSWNKLNDLDPPNGGIKPKNVYICCHCGVTLFRAELLFSMSTPGLVNETLVCFRDIFICFSVLFLSAMLLMVVVPIHLGLPLSLQVIYMYLRASANTLLLFLYSDKPTRKESLLMLCPTC